MRTISRFLVIPALIAAVAVPTLAAPNATTNQASIRRNSAIAMQNRRMLKQNRRMLKQNRKMVMQNRRMIMRHNMMHHSTMQHGMTSTMPMTH